MRHHLPNVKKSWFKITKKGRVLHCVAALIGCACLTGPATAADFTIDGAEVNSTQILDTSGDTGTVTNTGSIIVEDESGVEISDGTGFTLANAGSITTAGNYTYGVDGSWLDHSSITNSGTITATTTSNYANATGIRVSGLSLESTINNSGLITTTGNSFSNLTTGIFVGTLEDDSTVINSGSITAENNGIFCSATGIFVYTLQDSSSVINSGTITATGNGYITGIGINNISYDSSIGNSGTINVIADNSAKGIRTLNIYNNSSIGNTGTISAIGYYSATGLSAGNLNYNSSIGNSGTISATSTYGQAMGISAGNRYEGVFNNSSISNTGTVRAASTYGPATGISTGNRYESVFNNSSINNTGIISATSASGEATGISTSSTVNNSFVINSGTIYANTDTGQATGVSVYSIDNNSSISNSGTIGATAVNGWATGISTYYIDSNSSISNTGTIAATTTNGWAFGISNGYNYGGSSIRNSAINNAGTITATATNGEGFNRGGAVGILFWDLTNSSISNDSTGILSISSDQGAVGVEADMLDGASIISNDGIIRINSSGFVAVGIAGINLDDHSSMTNSGTIEVKTTSSDFSEFNVGLLTFYASPDSVITNAGTIGVSSTGYGYFDAGILCKYGNGTINNSGTITLTQDNSYGFPSAGILNLGGSPTISNSGTIQAFDSSGDISRESFSVFTLGGDLENESSGILKGRLHVGGNVDNQGTIYLPAPATTGYAPYLGVRAMAPFTSGSDYAGSLVNAGTISFTFQNDEDPANISYSTLQVGDSAELRDGSTINVDIHSASHLMVGQTMEGVIRASDIVADLNQVNVTDNSALLVFTPVISNTTSASEPALLAFSPEIADGETWLDLNIEGRTILETTRSSGKYGVLGTAAALDSLLDSDDPDIRDFIDNLYTYATDDEVAGDVIQVSPVIATSSPMVNYSLLNTISGVIQSRQQNITGFNSGDQMFSDRNLWIKPLGSHTEQDNRDGINGFSANSYGLGLGADGEYSNDGRLGLAFFYTNADVDSRHVNQDSDLDVFNLMAYGSNPLLNGSTELFYQLGGGLQDTDTRRHIMSTGDTAKADFTSESLFARVKGAKTFQPTDKLQTMVGLGMAYIYYYNPSYHESGAGGLDLDVDSFDSNALVATLDGDLSYTLGAGVQLLANGSLGYDLIDDDTTVDADFQGANTVVFATDGIDNSPFIFKVGAGLAMELKNNLSVDLKYNLDGRASDYLNHAVTAQVNWKF